jgi:hypothetical protein
MAKNVLSILIIMKKPGQKTEEIILLLVNKLVVKLPETISTRAWPVT